jgi:hypothetical protein
MVLEELRVVRLDVSTDLSHGLVGTMLLQVLNISVAHDLLGRLLLVGTRFNCTSLGVLGLSLNRARVDKCATRVSGVKRVGEGLLLNR